MNTLAPPRPPETQKGTETHMHDDDERLCHVFATDKVAKCGQALPNYSVSEIHSGGPPGKCGLPPCAECWGL